MNLPFQFKNHVPTMLLWVLLTLGLAYMVFTSKVSLTEAGAFLVAMGVPSLLMAKEEIVKEEEKPKEEK